MVKRLSEIVYDHILHPVDALGGKCDSYVHNSFDEDMHILRPFGMLFVAAVQGLLDDASYVLEKGIVRSLYSIENKLFGKKRYLAPINIVNRDK